ncbi:MAG: hypothetical protein M1815_005702 [Lichina confinis]|nr:MAG: hypothetical protein M1815_005702 [Lichina confinis]
MASLVGRRREKLPQTLCAMPYHRTKLPAPAAAVAASRSQSVVLLDQNPNPAANVDLDAKSRQILPLGDFTPWQSLQVFGTRVKLSLGSICSPSFGPKRRTSAGPELSIATPVIGRNDLSPLD